MLIAAVKPTTVRVIPTVHILYRTAIQCGINYSQRRSDSSRAQVCVCKLYTEYSERFS